MRELNIAVYFKSRAIMYFDKFVIVFLVMRLFAFEIGVDGANILACLTSASQSHHIIETTILEELAKRGHNVILLERKKLNQ